MNSVALCGIVFFVAKTRDMFNIARFWFSNTHDILTTQNTGAIMNYYVVLCVFVCSIGGFTVKVSYKKLWVMCAERDMSKGELRKKAGVSSATFTKLRKNQEVALSVLLKIADVMECNAGDMMDFIKDEETVLPEIDADEVW